MISFCSLIPFTDEYYSVSLKEIEVQDRNCTTVAVKWIISNFIKELQITGYVEYRAEATSTVTIVSYDPKPDKNQVLLTSLKSQTGYSINVIAKINQNTGIVKEYRLSTIHVLSKILKLCILTEITKVELDAVLENFICASIRFLLGYN